MLNLTLREIVDATSGKLLGPSAGPVHPAPPSHFADFVSDSRKVRRGSIFLCILGEKVDGHDFADDVATAGAALVIGENRAKLEATANRHPATSFLCVDSALKALQNLATFYRKKFSIPVIGLTGSSGKTTTKDLFSSILEQGTPGLVTEGTLNNHWGVPQMVLRLRPEHKVAVFEMGTSDFGEITLLTSICQPTIGYITTVGASHLEKLGNEQGVLRAKRELFDWIARNGSAERTLIFNIDSPHLAKLYSERKDSTRRFSLSRTNPDADAHVAEAVPLGIEDRFGWKYRFDTPWGKVAGTLPLPGYHNLSNALAAAALALVTGAANPEQVARGLAQPKISKLRSDLFKLRSGAVVYNDSYNANPTSVTALFEAAAAIRAGGQTDFSRTVAAVGDMLELGADSPSLHRAMGRKAAENGVDVLLSTGQFAREWVAGYGEAKERGIARSYENRELLTKALNIELCHEPRKTLLLIKGSRGAKMDQVVEAIKAAP